VDVLFVNTSTALQLDNIHPLFHCRNLTSYQAKTSTTSLEIVLDRAGMIYTTGSEVTGQVVITATEQVNFDQIIVTLKGEGRVYPSHYGKILSYVRGLKYAGHHHGEVYCAKSTILLDNRNQLARQTLPAGEHRFPFRFRLTGSRLPTSFKGSLGYISYFVGAKVVRSSSKKDIVASVEIPFVETVDINCDQLLKPVCIEGKKTVYNLHGASSPSTLRVKLDRSGFCIGERIPIQADIQNGSGRNVTLQAKLVRKSQFGAADHQVDCTSEVLKTVSGPQIAPADSFQWNSDSLVVPATDPTIATCSYISVFYVLKVFVVIPQARNCTITIPITIGNVPLAEQ